MAQDKQSIGCGVFLVLAGVVMLAERMGWFYVDATWILPGIIILVGVVKLIDALR
jgi:hypothetical protein